MKINIKPIRSLSILYSALNYNGYDKENNPKGMHHLRVWVRERLDHKQIDRFDFRWHPYQYTKAVLTTDNLTPTKSTRPDFSSTINYLTKFTDQSDFEKLWPKIKNETKMALALYKPLIKKTIEGVNECFEMKKSSKETWFTVNLLESYMRGFSIQTKDRIIIITGPSTKPNVSNLIHEYIHACIHHKTSGSVDEQIYKQIPKRLQQNYPEKIITEECLVRALEVYLSRHKGIPGQTKLDNQAKALLFPKIYLKNLEKAQPKKISLDVLRRIL